MSRKRKKFSLLPSFLSSWLFFFAGCFPFVFHSLLSCRGNLTMRNWWPKSVIIDPNDGNIIFGVICWLISDRSSFTSCFTCPSFTSHTRSAPKQTGNERWIIQFSDQYLNFQLTWFRRYQKRRCQHDDRVRVSVMKNNGAEKMTLKSLPHSYPLIKTQSNDVAGSTCYRHQAIFVCL